MQSIDNRVPRVPFRRLVYNGMSLIPCVGTHPWPFDHDRLEEWHVPGGEVLTTAQLAKRAYKHNVVIRLIGKERP